jgi:HEAT repeat protein
MALSVASRFPRDAQVAAAPQLAAMLQDESETAANRANVVRLIGMLEDDARPVLPKLLASMRDDPDKSVRSACLMAVSRIADSQDALAVFRQALTGDAEAGVRGVAAARLGRLGPAAAAASPDLADALEDRDENVARKAADALVAIGAASVPPATDKLASADPRVRRLAVFVLGKLGTAALPALDELRKRLRDEDEEVRKLAEFAIRRIEGSR